MTSKRNMTYVHMDVSSWRNIIDPTAAFGRWSQNNIHENYGIKEMPQATIFLQKRLDYVHDVSSKHVPSGHIMLKQRWFNVDSTFWH